MSCLLYLKVRVYSQKVQADIILESDIICCTLSASGGGLLESTFSRQGLDPFSCVIVDEVSKTNENYNVFHHRSALVSAEAACDCLATGERYCGLTAPSPPYT